MKFSVFSSYEHWHIRIGRFYLGFWKDDDLGWDAKKFVSKYDDDPFYFIAFKIGEVRWYL